MSTKRDRDLGMHRAITRRDFIGSTIIGSGVMLLSAAATAVAQGLTSEWNGYAGVGDYSRSNGDIVVRRRHGRIAFGHSELSGRQCRGRAAQEARRALREVLEVI